MNYLNKLVFFMLLCLLIQACDESTGELVEPDVNVDYDVIILNEGNFRTANASVDFYSSTSDERVAKVFQSANDSRPLGDVAQSMIEYNGKYYIVVNNSSKIEVLNSDFRGIGQITGLNSPRYILPTHNDFAYVSDIYEDKLYKVDLESFTVVTQLNFSGWIEEMVKVNDYAFLCNRDSSQILVVDYKKDSLIKKIKTNASPNSLVVDKNEKIWVSCSGNNSSYAALHQIDSDSLKINKTIEAIDNYESISELEINPSGDNLYYLNNGVFKFSINDSALPSTPFVSQGNKLFYALGIHPNSDEIYVSDAIDYVQSGVVFRYNSIGQEITNFRTGIIPGFIYFQ